MVTVLPESSVFQNNVMRYAHRALFMHFMNREYYFTHRLSINESQLIEKMNLCALLTTGSIQLPFAQASELSWKAKKLQNQITALAANGKLILVNQNKTFDEFVESRREMYGQYGAKAPYEMYFCRKPLFGQHYTRAPGLRTTEKIKSDIIAAVNPGAGTSNLFSEEERNRLKLNEDYIKRHFRDAKSAVTFSVFRHEDINPKPAEQLFFGRIATRLFLNHYSSALDLIVPTGFLNDQILETYELFPIFDLPVNFVLFKELGLESLLRETQLPQLLINFLNSDGFSSFCELRVKLLSALASTLRQENPTALLQSDRIASEIKSLMLGKVSTSSPLDGFALTNLLEKAIQRRSSNDIIFAAEWDATPIMRNSRKKIVLFTATNIEAQTLRAKLVLKNYGKVEIRTENGVTFTVYSKKDVELCHVITSMGTAGMGASLQVSQKILPVLKPDLVISVGICFGIDDENQSFTDVIVSEWVEPYEAGKITNAKFEHRGKGLPCCDQVVSYARHLSGSDGIARIHVGTVFSGEKLINSSEKKAELLKIDGKGIGGDMEAAGIATTCASERIRFSMIKGISDFADRKGDEYQAKAAENAIDVVLTVIEHLHS